MFFARAVGTFGGRCAIVSISRSFNSFALVVRTLLLLIAATLQLPPSPAPRDARSPHSTGSASISGRITDRLTGRPIQRAIVTVALLDSADRKWLYIPADADGRYEASQLEPGEYFVAAGPPDMRATYLRQAFGETDPMDRDRPTANLVLAAGDVRTDVDIALARALAIEGRVLDESDEPMAEVGIELLRADGTEYSSPTESDDRGQFRVFGLVPGRYHVCARPVERAPDSSADTLRYVRTCHLAATQKTAAADIVLSGDDVSGIDIRIQRSRTYSLSGTVIDASGKLVDGAFVGANPAEEGSGAHGVTKDGRFVLHGLPPGRYHVAASFGGPRDPGDLRPPARERETAFTIVDVSGDVSGVNLNLSKPQTVSGRVVFEHAAGRLPRAAGMVVQTNSPPSPWIRLHSRPPYASVGDNLRFEVAGIYHDPLIVGIYGLPDGWVMKFVRHGDVDITDRPIDLATEPRRELQIVLTDRVARPVVRVTNADGTPAKRAGVVLLPADTARWNAPRFGAREHIGRDGTATLDAVPPGEYLLAAIAGADYALLMHDPARIESLASLARRVTILEGDTRVFDAPLVSLPSKQ